MKLQASQKLHKTQIQEQMKKKKYLEKDLYLQDKKKYCWFKVKGRKLLIIFFEVNIIIIWYWNIKI